FLLRISLSVFIYPTSAIFRFNAPPPPATYTLSLHDALPIYRVAEQRFSGERRQHVRHHPHGRKDEDVYLRVAEQPEQVLPQDRRRAGFAHVEMRAEEAVEHQEREPHRDDWKRRNDQELGDERHPGEHG